MQQQAINRGPAIKFGLIGGIVFAVWGVGQQLLLDPRTMMTNQSLAIAVSAVSCIVSIAIYILIGWLSGRGSGAAEKGGRAKAGLLAGLIAGLVSLVATLILTGIQYSDGTMERMLTEQIRAMPSDQRAAMQQMGGVGGMMTFSLIASAVCGGILSVGMGLGLGALGGSLSPEPKH
jgi:hypothetical protein